MNVDPFSTKQMYPHSDDVGLFSINDFDFNYMSESIHHADQAIVLPKSHHAKPSLNLMCKTLVSNHKEKPLRSFIYIHLFIVAFLTFLSAFYIWYISSSTSLLFFALGTIAHVYIMHWAIRSELMAVSIGLYHRRVRAYAVYGLKFVEETMHLHDVEQTEKGFLLRLVDHEHYIADSLFDTEPMQKEMNDYYQRAFMAVHGNIYEPRGDEITNAILLDAPSLHAYSLLFKQLRQYSLSQIFDAMHTMVSSRNNQTNENDRFSTQSFLDIVIKTVQPSFISYRAAYNEPYSDYRKAFEDKKDSESAFRLFYIELFRSTNELLRVVVQTVSFSDLFGDNDVFMDDEFEDDDADVDDVSDVNSEDLITPVYIANQMNSEYEPIQDGSEFKEKILHLSRTILSYESKIDAKLCEYGEDGTRYLVESIYNEPYDKTMITKLNLIYDVLMDRELNVLDTTKHDILQKRLIDETGNLIQSIDSRFSSLNQLADDTVSEYIELKSKRYLDAFNELNT